MLKLFKPFELRGIHAAVVFAPAVIGNIGNSQGLDDRCNGLSLADQDVCFTQLGDNLFGAILLSGLDLLPFQPLTLTQVWHESVGSGQNLHQDLFKIILGESHMFFTSPLTDLEASHMGSQS